MRILEPYKDYFWDFYNPLKQNVKDKVDYVITNNHIGENGTDKVL